MMSSSRDGRRKVTKTTIREEPLTALWGEGGRGGEGGG
jgi:hypothetical protein